MSDSPSAAIIVVHFGRAAPTLACLKSIDEDPSPVLRTVVVVDNSSSFASPPADAMLVSCPENPGFGAAVNRGVASLDHRAFDFIVVLNNDIVIRPGYLQAAAEALLDGDPRTAVAAGPLALDENGSRLWYAGGGINFLTGTVTQSRSPVDAQRRRPVGFIPGSAFAINPEAWEDVGGFDPSFFLYSEDVDLCLRLRRRGWRLTFEPGMAAVHNLGQSTGSQSASPLYLYYVTRNRLRPFRPGVYRFYLAILHSGYVLGRAVFRILSNHRTGLDQARALLSGHWNALKGLVQNRPMEIKKVEIKKGVRQ
ncbi:MAG: glycosyltransferase family 2 protein [Acidobacteria bacterium]|nr:glycosyltransferase family 2 protein [Acidobacteriota bacterium]